MSPGEPTDPAGTSGVTVALAVVVREERVLLARRPQGRHLGGFWEFPGGKVEPGESPAAAAIRELEEETGVRAGSAELFFEKQPFSRRVRSLYAFLLVGTEGEGQPLDSDELTWLPLAELTECRMPAVNRPIVEALMTIVERRARGRAGSD